MAKKQTKPVAKGSDDRKLFAFLATFLSIVGFVIAVVAKRDDRYVMFYAKQSLVVFIVAIVGAVINSILMWIPIFGWIIAGIINLFVLVLWIFSWVNALSEEEKETPIVGQYARKFNF
jgi:uncharacterized membrane protein